MKKFEIEINLQHMKEAKEKAVAANREFLSRVDTALVRLIHEAAAQRMSAQQVAKLSGFTTAQIKARMKAMGLNPTTGRALLSKQAAAVLESNAEIMGIQPHEIDLMSPLAYLPAGSLLKEQVSSVTDLEEPAVSGNDEAAIRADERERLANDAYERGDIGKEGEITVWDWLLRQDGTATPKRRLTRPAQADEVVPEPKPESPDDLVIDPVCAEKNPGLDEWNGNCCRFPKTCSPHITREGLARRKAAEADEVGA